MPAVPEWKWAPGYGVNAEDEEERPPEHGSAYLARAARLEEEAGVENPDDREALERASLEVDSLPISEEEKRAVVLTMYRSGWRVDADDFDEDGQPHHAEFVTNLSPQQALDRLAAVPAPVLAPEQRARRNLGGGSRRPGHRSTASRSRGSPRRRGSADDDVVPPRREGAA